MFATKGILDHRFCSIHTYTYTRMRDHNRSYCIYTVIIYYRGPTFRGLRYFPYSQQMVFLFIFPVYVYIVRLILLLLLSLYIVLSLLVPSRPVIIICHSVRRRAAAAVRCSDMPVAAISPRPFRGRKSIIIQNIMIRYTG